jgi:hypothetical protein
LPNDAPQGYTLELIVKGNRNGDRRVLSTLLHDPVASLLPDRGESVLFEDTTTSEPERPRSLPKRYLNLSNKYLVMKPAG